MADAEYEPYKTKLTPVYAPYSNMQVTLYIFHTTVLFICWLVLWNVSTLKWCSFSANLTILSQVETNAAHIIGLLEDGL